MTRNQESQRRAEGRGNRYDRGAYEEAEDSPGREGENEDLFDPAVVDWASENGDEISTLAYELEEGTQLVEE